MVTRIGPRRPFRHYIREWINYKQLTQAEVAGRIGCGEGTLSKKINSRSHLTMEWVEKIAHALDLEPLDLFRDPTAPQPEDLLRSATDDQRAQAIRVLKALTGTDA